MKGEEGFYNSLRSFSQFEEIVEDRHFTKVPSDWVIVITDVKGSTKAIETGRYKDVNTIGAASIAVVQNTLEGIEFPYVFGGDGATMLIPKNLFPKVARQLGALKNLSRKNFGLELRVGSVEMDELLSVGAVVEVAKFELFAQKYVAIFRGGGLTVAEKMVKGNQALYEIPDVDGADANLGGLSCRWQDIPNRQGKVLSILVVATGENGKKTYLDFILNFSVKAQR